MFETVKDVIYGEDIYKSKNNSIVPRGDKVSLKW
jgi:hypothetical protein